MQSILQNKTRVPWIPISMLVRILITIIPVLFSTLLSAQTVSLSKKQATVQTVFKEITQQTGYQVVCDSSLLSTARPVDVDFREAGFASVVSHLFPKGEATWSLSGKTLIIKVAIATTNPPGIAGSKEIQVIGMVKDNQGQILPGVSVNLKGRSTVGTSTDLNGRYELSVPQNSVLVFSMVSYLKKEVQVGTKRVIDVVLQEDKNDLEEVVVTAFGNIQKKTDVIGSISSISPKDLKIPSSNLTTALQGRIAGIVSFQRSGEPGSDNADFFIRGLGTFGVNQTPLILIDNMEVTTDQLARLPPDDIASFSILKDATATAVYGSRGANGIILVTTEVGVEGPAKITARVESRISAPTEKIRTADPVTFMKMNNEAVQTRNELAVTPYSEEKIALTAQGANPILYPAVNWLDMVTENHASTQNYSLSVSGGSKLVSYAVSGSLTDDNGLLKVNPINNFNSNVDFKTYNIRSNINLNLTKTTQLMVRTIGNLQTYNGPPVTGSQAYTLALNASPVLFQPTYQAGPEQSYIRHPLFGGFGTGDYVNPYASIVRGYQQRNTNNLQIQIDGRQDLSSIITEGLSYRLLTNITRASEYQVVRQYSPFFYQPVVNSATGAITYTNLNPTGSFPGTETLDFSVSGRGLNAIFYMENALNYQRLFAEKHAVSAMVINTIRNRLTQPTGDDGALTVTSTLPFRNVSYSGSFTYAYDSRYHVQFTFGYNGSERFDKKSRWGFFPSAGIAWTISNETFMKPLQKIVSNLRLRATHGLVGNDAISNTRFFYLSDVNLNNAARAYSFGIPGALTTTNGVSVNRYANPDVQWEVSRQTNLGLDLGLFNNTFNLTAELYRQERTDIVQERSNVPDAIGFSNIPLANLGGYRSEGVDIESTYNYNINRNLWIQGRATLNFSRGKYTRYEEARYKYPYQTRIGTAASTVRGYIAERLFTDDEEVFNSPSQAALGGVARGGDIKYLDANNDGIINSDDTMPIGLPQTPGLNYGFGLSTGYKKFDFSFFFSGVGATSLFIQPANIVPFGSATAPRAVLGTIADSYWSEDNQNLYAFWPRLSASAFGNNTQPSTYWMRDGSFLRLKQVELGYKLSEKFIKRFHLRGLRFYASATNLFVLSSFKEWDPEMGNNGFAYPLQKVFNAGILLNL